MHILENLKKRAQEIGGTIVLPEALDERIIKAAAIIVSEKLAKVVLLANKDK